MIISPPFLPSAQANESDADYVKRAMTGDAPGNGAYPVSNNLGWHGGLHLEAPVESGARLPVRAIADGTVKYVRQPKAMPEKLDESTQDPLYYHSGWTDNGVVVIEHKTDIGEGANATNVIYYSIYLHLHSIAQAFPAAGKPVWRKDEIGQAGYIYGKPNWIHFEIVCDEVNLTKLVNRSSGTLSTSTDGRTDSIWGEIYVKVPSGAELKAMDPQAKPASGSASASDAGRKETTEDYFIGIRYDRGHCITSTYKEDGSLVGTAIDDADYEYGLYDAANKHFKACPSAGYEMLRFGRVLGPDALNPADAPHWRKIGIASGQYYINLNATNTKKFSDADFPHWRNWFLIDDDTAPDDSRCDSDLIAKLILDDGEQFLNRNQLISRLSAVDIEKKALARTICKFPSEWAKDTIDTRWNWLKDAKKTADASVVVMSDDDFTLLRQHLEALCFWSEAGLSAIPTPWHFEPREFITAFRTCGWLSQNELIQLFPKTAMRQSKKKWVSESVTPATGNLANNAEALNKMTRKFGIFSPLRLSAFYANALVETGWMRLLVEGPNGQRYLPWQGRGFMQLTWPNNYIKYWRFLGRTISEEIEEKLAVAQKQADSKKDSSYLDDKKIGLLSEIIDWRNDVSSSPDSADSAGAYWAWSGAAKLADEPAVFVRETKIIDGEDKPYYTHSNFGQVAATVNVGHASASYSSVNGIVARFQAFTSAAMVLMDAPQFPDVSNVMQVRPDGYVSRRPT